MVRKSGMGVDRKITYADFVEGIGNSAINGYISSQDEEQENKIILKAANNAIKKFGEAYVNEHLTKCINTGVSSKELEQGLKDVIGSVFNM